MKEKLETIAAVVILLGIIVVMFCAGWWLVSVNMELIASGEIRGAIMLDGGFMIIAGFLLLILCK